MTNEENRNIDLEVQMFGRPVAPFSTFEETVADIQLLSTISEEEFKTSREAYLAERRITAGDYWWSDTQNIQGPYSAWPRPVEHEEDELALREGEVVVSTRLLTLEEYEAEVDDGTLLDVDGRGGKPFPSFGDMAKSLAKTTAQAFSNAPVSKEVYEKRLETCRQCPAFDARSQRCRDCGCYLPAKAYVGGDPDNLCPQKKWGNL